MPTPNSAKSEIDLWFEPHELITWDQSMANWIVELQNSPIDFEPEDADHPGHLAGHPNRTNPDLAFKPTY